MVAAAPAYRRVHGHASADVVRVPSRSLGGGTRPRDPPGAMRAGLRRVLVRLRGGEEFAAALAPVRPMLEGTGYEHFEYQVDLTEAYYALLRGDRPTCHAKLRTGLARAREERAPESCDRLTRRDPLPIVVAPDAGCAAALHAALAL